MFIANEFSDSVSIIDLANSNNVTNVPLGPSGGDTPVAIAFDEEGQRVFTANVRSDSVPLLTFLIQTMLQTYLLVLLVEIFQEQ